MLESFVGALFLAAVLIVGWRFTGTLGHGRRRIASASAGVAVAYVFIYMLPELSEAGDSFVEATRGQGLPLPEYRLYVAALGGFVLMYGVQHLRKWSRVGGERAEKRTFNLHLGGFAAYVGVVAFMMAESQAQGELPVGLYSFAMGLHFLGIAGDLSIEHGPLYMKPGRFVLAGCVLAGWLIGSLARIPPVTFYTLLGLVSGGVVVNSMIMELPDEKDGRFWPFVIGAGVYSLVLLLLARERLSGAEGQAADFTTGLIDRMAARLTGPMNFRFVLQPAVAMALGIRDGRLDARAGTPPFVYDVVFDAQTRDEYLRSALTNLIKPVILGTVLDAISQYQLFGHVRPFGALFVGIGVLGLPYALSRGISNRWSRAHVLRSGAPAKKG